MYKAISKYFVFFVSAILVITNSFFIVSADYDGEFFMVPYHSIAAYNFFGGYGLTYNQYKTIGTSTSSESSYNITENGYTISIPTQSYYSYIQYLDNVGGGSRTYFVNNNGTAQAFSLTNPSHVETVPAHTISVPSHNITENNSIYSYLNYGELTGNLVNPTGYNTSKRFLIAGKQTTVLTFMSSSNLQTAITGYSSTGNSSDVTIKSVLNQFSYGTSNYYRYTYTFYNNTSSALYFSPTFNFSSLSNIKIIPIYLGDKRAMSTELRESSGIDSETVSQIKITNQLLDELSDYILNGNSQTDNIVDNSNNSTDEFNNISSDLHSIEDSSINDMQSQLNNINLDNELYSNSGFVDGIWFVKAIFNQLTTITQNNNAPIRLMIVFSLVLGIALTIIGKLRN